MQRRRTALYILIVVTCLATSLSAQRLPDYSQGILDRQDALNSAAEVSRQVYPNADTVLVDESGLCVYRPDGTGVDWSDSYTKVLTEKGRREEQTLSAYFILPYQEVAVTRLEVIKPDGSAVAVDIDKQSKVMTDPSQMNMNIYDPNSKVLRVGLPGVEIGDVIHTVMRRDINRRYMPNTWDDYQVFEYTSPIKHATYEVHSPKELPLCRIILKDPVEGTVTHEEQERDGRIVNRWEVSNVPRIYREPDMPPTYTVVQRLLVSTLPDWKAISSWYWRLCEPHLEATSPEMQEMVDSLTSGLTDRREKIEAIFYWVSQQVRYMGITTEKTAPGWEPHDVKLTFANRHGVCRDKAALLAAMLRLADFEAYPILIDAGPKKDEEVPVVLFNHAITCVREEDGSYLLMDCTDESTKELLPSYLCDRSYLIAHPEGKTLQTSPIVPAEENMVLVETTGAVDAQGNLTAETKLRFAGVNDNAYRGYFAQIKPEERRRYFEGVLKASMAAATMTEFDLRPVDIQDMSESLSVRMKFAAKDILVGEGETMMMPLPNVGAKVGLVNFIIGKTGLKKRRFPLQTQFACGVRERLDLQVDPAIGSFVSLPEFAPREDETITWRRRLEREADSVRGQAEFLIKVPELSPEQYLRLKEHLREIEYNDRKMPILARRAGDQGPASDIVLLDHHVAYDLTDAHNWTERHRVRKKVLTYKGMKDHAEVKLGFNPVWEEVKFLKATVSRNEQTKEISDEEINLMDAAWAASAPRYPAGKTLVASLPAVEVGSVIEYEYERIRKDRPFFAATHVFRSFDPVTRRSIRLTAPAALDLRIVKDDNGITVPDEAGLLPGQQVIVESEERRGQKVVWKWTAEDQAALEREDYLPPLLSFNPGLRVTAGNWPAYSEKIRAALHEAALDQTAAQRQARQIARDAETSAGKITAVRDFVAKSIRAAGPALDDLPLTAITQADRTLADGYGNTTDRAVLLYAMLQALGFSPEFVLVHYGSSVDELKAFSSQYPSADAFGQVLVRVQAGSTQAYLNDTSQYAALGATPADGHLALPLRQGVTDTVSIAPDKQDLTQFEFRITLSETGDARIAVTRKSSGGFFAARHKMYAEMPPEERSRFHQELVGDISQAAVADSDLVTDFDSYPGVESFAVRVERYAVLDGDFLYFELPRSLRNLLGLRSDTHVHPLYRSRAERLRMSTVVELPPAYSEVVLAPASKQWRLPDPGGTVRVEVAAQDSDGVPTLAFTHEVDLKPIIVEAENYPDLLAIDRELAHSQSRTVLLQRTE